jgi:tetratricopeptide (TPR) repeat protein
LSHNRLSRHEIKEDSFVTWVLRAWEYIREHQNRFFTILVVILVAIAASLWLVNSRNQTKSEAKTQFAEALNAFSAGELRTAEEMFKQLADRFRGLEEGANSSYFAGKCAYEDGRFSHSIEHFQRYLDDAGDSGFFHDAAMEGLASAWENDDNYSAASDIYMQLADNMKTNTFMEMTYLRKAADTFKLSMNNDKAIEALQRLLELSSGTERRDIEIEIEILRI